jgi:hypothetical protein
MEGYCSTDQNPQWAVVPMEEEYYGAYFKLDCKPKMAFDTEFQFAQNADGQTCS